MKLALLILSAAGLFAQLKDLAPRYIVSYTVATLPAAASWSGYDAVVTDALTAGNCTTGGGTALALCRSNGSAWISLGGGSAATGLAAVATSATVLTVTAGSCQIGTKQYEKVASTGTLSGTSASSTAFRYCDSSGTLTIGHNGAATLTCANCTTATGITDFPVDSIPLGTVPYTANVWGTPVPYIPTNRRDVLAAGTGISIAADGAGVQTITSTGGAPITARRYFPFGTLAPSTGNFTTVFSANETRWQQFHLLGPITISNIGIRFTAGLGASKGVRFAIADTAGTILGKSAVNNSCGSVTCVAAITPLTLAAGVYYAGITTDSTALTTVQSVAFFPEGAYCGAADLGTVPYLAGTGTAGTGADTAVDFGASMGTLTPYVCNGGTNTFSAKFHDMWFQ